jgi:hypothetical protein
MLSEANILFKIYYTRINIRNIIIIIVNLIIIPILIQIVIAFGIFSIFPFTISLIRNTIFLIYILIPVVLLIVLISTIVSAVYLFFRKSLIVENYIVLSNNIIKMENIIDIKVSKNIFMLYIKPKTKIKFKANNSDINNIHDYILSIINKNNVKQKYGT